MNTVVHLINGILNFPGDSQNWNGRGVTWLHTHLAHLPRHVDRVKIIMGGPWLHYGHSDCWAAMEFDETMKNFVP